MPGADTLFTIGHSTHTETVFTGLLARHGVMAVCDVRSKPYSRLQPQFNREALREILRANGIAYVFLGRELGARSEDPGCYQNGRVQYDRLARTDLFQSGIERVREGMSLHRIALVCAEKEPLDCHRTILIARHMEALGVDVRHIHADGSLESHGDAMTRLARMLRMDGPDLFRSEEEVLADVYLRQEERIAHEPAVPAAAHAVA